MQVCISAGIFLNIDIAPAILALAGVDVPDRVQGRSLLSLVRGQRIGWREDFFYEHLFEHPFQGVNNIPKSEGVVTKRFKYLRYPVQEPVQEELYDLKSVPYEKRTWQSTRIIRKSCYGIKHNDFPCYTCQRNPVYLQFIALLLGFSKVVVFPIRYDHRDRSFKRPCMRGKIYDIRQIPKKASQDGT